ncbi:hypothetical protein ACFYVL_17255 [Streptomyces sp. NPDC004111]|uniref:hypothetical protein n=1 Tax=Streptomyces sp. NPDC004111 TaxID=3364690 RepID=UPI0036BB08F3
MSRNSAHTRDRLPRLGVWRIIFQDPREDRGSWTYAIPARAARTEALARKAAKTLHAQARARAADRAQWSGLAIGEVALVPAALSADRAAAWAALVDCGALHPVLGWRSAHAARQFRDEGWREDVRSLHEQYREQTTGCGVSLADILQDLAGTDAALDVKPYRDVAGRVDWDAVRADIRHGAMSTLRQTPYGLIWINDG